jgi:hypothetical protein
MIYIITNTIRRSFIPQGGIQDDIIFGKSYEEGRNGGLPQENLNSRFLKANRRFFLPPYDLYYASSRIHSSGNFLNNLQI